MTRLFLSPETLTPASGPSPQNTGRGAPTLTPAGDLMPRMGKSERLPRKAQSHPLPEHGAPTLTPASGPSPQNMGRGAPTLTPAGDPSPQNMGRGAWKAYRDRLFPSPDVAGEGSGMGADIRQGMGDV